MNHPGQKHQLSRLPQRMHHRAVMIEDQEENRRLIEDVLGIPLIATWSEVVPDPRDPSRMLDLCHVFYGLEDGSALAFFQFGGDNDLAELRGPALPLGLFEHVALKVSRETYDELGLRLDENHEVQVKHFEIAHGYCMSRYIESPQGYTLEITLDSPNYEDIMAIRSHDPHRELQKWLAGDHRSNNLWKGQRF